MTCFPVFLHDPEPHLCYQLRINQRYALAPFTILVRLRTISVPITI